MPNHALHLRLDAGRLPHELLTDAQTELSRRLPLCMATLLGTHNSGITIADGYGNRDEHFQQYFKWIRWVVSCHLSTWHSSMQIVLKASVSKALQQGFCAYLAMGNLLLQRLITVHSGPQAMAMLVPPGIHHGD